MFSDEELVSKSTTNPDIQEDKRHLPVRYGIDEYGIIPVHINSFKSNSQHVTLSSIGVFKQHPLTVTMVTKYTYYH